MSLIKKADVKNHLSARHRSEIHLAPPQSQSEAATSEDPKVSDSVETSLKIPAPSDADAIAPATAKSVKA